MSNNSKSFVHPLTTVSMDLEKIAVIPMPTQGPLNNKKYLRNLILLPKVAWTFKEMDIKDMFPIPHGVPFEDIWFSLYVYSKDIEIINDGKVILNTGGGILNMMKSSKESNFLTFNHCEL